MRYSDKEVVKDANKLLWTAPEYLRDSHDLASQPGDVYSFAIIAQEVLLQAEPYFHNRPQCAPDEIVEKLKVPPGSIIRPVIPKGKLSHCISFFLKWFNGKRPTQRRIIGCSDSDIPENVEPMSTI